MIAAFLNRIYGYIAAAAMSVAVALGLLAIHLNSRRKAADERAAKARAEAAAAGRVQRHTSTVAEADRKAQESATIAINAATKAAREKIVRDYFEDR